MLLLHPSSRSRPARPALARLAVLALLAALAPRITEGGQRPVFGGELRRVHFAPVTTLDPVHAASFEELEVVRNVHATLVERRDDGTFAPALAVDLATAGSTPATLELHLRPGLTFHGGRALLAGDAVASLKRLWTIHPWIARLPGIPPATGIRASGTATILVDLPARDPRPVLELLSHPMASITLPPDAQGNVDGAGPFSQSDREGDGARLRLVAFPKHFRGRPFLDAVTVTAVTAPSDQRRALEGDGWDVIDLPVAADPPKGLTPVEAPGEETVVLDLGPSAPARDELSRLAAAMLDRSAMISVILKGRGSAAWRLPSERLFPMAPPPLPAAPPAGPPRGRAVLAYPSHDTDLALAAERVKFELRQAYALDARGLPEGEWRARYARGELDVALHAVFLSPVALPLQLARHRGADLSALALPAGRAVDEGKLLAALLQLPSKSLQVPLFHRPRRLLLGATIQGVAPAPWGPPSYADAWRAYE